MTWTATTTPVQQEEPWALCSPRQSGRRCNWPTISFQTALWLWMTPQSPKPSCHDVTTGRWTLSSADTAAGRVPRCRFITNTINGGIECVKGSNAQVENRIGFYKRFCDANRLWQPKAFCLIGALNCASLPLEIGISCCQQGVISAANIKWKRGFPQQISSSKLLPIPWLKSPHHFPLGCAFCNNFHLSCCDGGKG